VELGVYEVLRHFWLLNCIAQ